MQPVGDVVRDILGFVGSYSVLALTEAIGDHVPGATHLLGRAGLQSEGHLVILTQELELEGTLPHLQSSLRVRDTIDAVELDVLGYAAIGATDVRVYSPTMPNWVIVIVSPLVVWYMLLRKPLATTSTG